MSTAMEDAELAALRRRAYGPDADIDADPAALARLDELERRHVTIEDEPEPSRGAPEPSAPTVPAETAPAPGSRSRRAPAWHGAMIIAVAALALLTGGAAAAANAGVARVEASATPTVPTRSAAFTFASDPRSTILLRIPVDGTHGHLLDLPRPEDGPTFATRNTLEWSQPLGEYYGFRLWIARDDADQGCILIGAVAALTHCASDAEQAKGALFVSVPYAAIRDDERPPGMTSEQSIGFWWIPSDTVIVLTGNTSDAVAH